MFKLWCESGSKKFHINGLIIGFHFQTRKLEPSHKTRELELLSKKIVPCESTAEEVSLEW